MMINYVRTLGDVMLLFLVPKFSRSLKEQIRNPNKEYIIDNGLRMTTGFYLLDDIGIAMENVVFLKLKQDRMNDPLSDSAYVEHDTVSLGFGHVN